MPAPSTVSQSRSTRRAPTFSPKSPTKSVANGFPASPNLPSMPSGLQNLSAYQIMAHRIANRVAEMAENYTLVERPNNVPQAAPASVDKRKPRKLEIRLDNESGEPITFSAPFLDNTLKKMLSLQTRMLQIGADLAVSEGIDEKTKKEQFAQSAELSKIIALICAEKARQGA